MDLMPLHNPYWWGRLEAQDLAVEALLYKINSSIHAWINSSQHGEQLSSSRKIIGLFGLMRDFGVSHSIPEVRWDVDGYIGKVRIGRVDYICQ
jgi:hypothetical protein